MSNKETNQKIDVPQGSKPSAKDTMWGREVFIGASVTALVLGYVLCGDNNILNEAVESTNKAIMDFGQLGLIEWTRQAFREPLNAKQAFLILFGPITALITYLLMFRR
jgi:hypothetical protein